METGSKMKLTRYDAIGTCPWCLMEKLETRFEDVASITISIL